MNSLLAAWFLSFDTPYSSVSSCLQSSSMSFSIHCDFKQLDMGRLDAFHDLSDIVLDVLHDVFSLCSICLASIAAVIILLYALQHIRVDSNAVQVGLVLVYALEPVDLAEHFYALALKSMLVSSSACLTVIFILCVVIVLEIH